MSDSLASCLMPVSNESQQVEQPLTRTGPVERVDPVVPCTRDVTFQSSNVLSSGFISNSSFNNCVFNFSN